MPCPGNWEYKDVDGYQPTLAERCQKLLVELRRGDIETSQAAQETRPYHGKMFDGLTPKGYPYFAGNYRGDARFECLLTYSVGVPGDWRVGTIPGLVAAEMSKFVSAVRAAILALDTGLDLRDLDRATRVNTIVVVASKLFEEFLRIHPYANGNGHIARLLVWFILGRYKIWPLKWTVEPSPPPPYAALIIRARDGDRGPLEQFIYSMFQP